MPWQRQVADVLGEYEQVYSGLIIPHYREAVITVPRQSGKTTLILALEVQRAVGWPTPQRIAYTAQSGKDAREKLVNDQFPLLDPRLPPRLPIKSSVARCMRGIGNEGVEFKNGSRIIILASDEASGHGKTLDFGVIDESFHDIDDRREQAMLPAMLTKPSAQILNISTAGTDKSPFLWRKVQAGRAAVAAGQTSGIAYFEWSADDDADIDDPETWYSCMPALGHTITEDVVRHARLTMTEGDFRRAMLNQWTSSDDRVIPAAAWDAVNRPDVTPEGSLVFAVDVDPDRAWSSVAVADSEGRCELLKRAEGVGWVVEYLVDLSRNNEMADIALDGTGPAANLADDLEAAPGVVHVLTAPEMDRACADFYDAVADRKIQVRRHSRLDAALAAAVKKQSGDTWRWARKNLGDDVSPLVALTIAYAKAAELGGEVFFSFG